MARNLSIVGGGVLLLASQTAGALSIDFDYQYDTNNFFGSSGSQQRQSLTAAGAFFEAHLSDSLSAITSGGFNHFDANFTHPGTGSSTTINDFSVAADTLTVFAGGRSLGGAAGQGGPGGFSCSGFGSFCNEAKTRGQAGATGDPATSTDFGPWGGAITFEPGLSWDFSGPDAGPAAGKNDFYSVALHELGHLLGFGPADSWRHWLDGGAFTGPHAVASNGGLAPALAGDGAHWSSGTTSTIFGSSLDQETAMDPSIQTGTRKVFTELDMAGLQDVGWQVVPLPPAVILFGSALLGLLGVGARRRGAA